MAAASEFLQPFNPVRGDTSFGFVKVDDSFGNSASWLKTNCRPDSTSSLRE
jgi:hypothetical protein